MFRGRAKDKAIYRKAARHIVDVAGAQSSDSHSRGYRAPCWKLRGAGAVGEAGKKGNYSFFKSLLSFVNANNGSLQAAQSGRFPNPDGGVQIFGVISDPVRCFYDYGEWELPAGA